MITHFSHIPRAMYLDAYRFARQAQRSDTYDQYMEALERLEALPLDYSIILEFRLLANTNEAQRYSPPSGYKWLNHARQLKWQEQDIPF